MPKSFADATGFLGRHTKVIELTGEGGGRVAVCPDLQGRVMTTSADGVKGPSLGWINYDLIASGKQNPAFNNYGGEDRFWLAPEGGQYALFFKLENKQVVQNWFTPPELNTGAFRVTNQDESSCRMTRRLRVTNASEATFDLDIERDVKVLSLQRFGELLGPQAARAVEEGQGRFVGFETANSAKNVGPMRWDMKSGLVSIWSLGQFPAGGKTAIIVPYKAGADKELGPVVTSDYFGVVPAERLQVTPTAILFRGDGHFRAKLGVAAKRVLPVAGSIDFEAGVLTIVQFSLPTDPAADLYVNNSWKILQQGAYAGDVFNTYNDGPSEPGAKPVDGSFYELETLSPTKPLAQGESLTHVHRTFHVVAEPAVLAKVAKAALGVELAEVRKFIDKQ